MKPGDKCDFSKARVGDRVETIEIGLAEIIEVGEIHFVAKSDSGSEIRSYLNNGYSTRRMNEFPSVFHPGSLETLVIQPPPKRMVKKVGWVNVYPRSHRKLTVIHRTLQEANVDDEGTRIACARIEWEEPE